MSRNQFSGVPVEFWIPDSAKVVFVSDFFLSEIPHGGAELTTDALITFGRERHHDSSVRRGIFHVHSQSVTIKMLEQSKKTEKHWVFGNFTKLDDSVIQFLPYSGLNYSVVEHDFKFCAFRSAVLHQKQTNKPCDCAYGPHGMYVSSIFQKARKVFWMSEGQKKHWTSHIPLYEDGKKHIMLGAVFGEESLGLLKKLKDKKTNNDQLSNVLNNGKYAIPQLSSWIKGFDGAKDWCVFNKIPFEVIPPMPPMQFLSALSEYKGLVFLPLDFDTSPRIVTEAKMLGLELKLNDNVLHKDEPWFSGSIENCEAHLSSRAKTFWDEIDNLLIAQ